MSYASVAAHDAPPLSEQPHPDPALLNTTPPNPNTTVDDAVKVNIVAPEFKEAPDTFTSDANIVFGGEDMGPRTSSSGRAPSKAKIVAPEFKEAPDTFTSDANIVFGGEDMDPRTSSSGQAPSKAKKRIREVQAEGAYLWQSAKKYLFRPGAAGGLLGLVNIGLLASAGRTFYLRPHLRRDVTAISSTIAVALTLISVEGYVVERYCQTPRGQETDRKPRSKGPTILYHLHEQFMRPGVLGGLVGVVNGTILSIVGYFSYVNWDKLWDRRTVSAVSIGLLTVWGGEVFVARRIR